MIDKLLWLCGGQAAVVQQRSHLAAELVVVLVGWARAGRRRGDLRGPDAGEAGNKNLVAEDEDARDGADGVGRGEVAPRAVLAGDQVLGAQFPDVVGALAGGIAGVA